MLAIGRRRNTGAPVLVRGGGDGADWSVLEPAGLPPDAAPLWPLLHFHFPTAQVGYAALDPDVTMPSPLRQALLATRDGGRTWEEVYASQGREGAPVARLHFADARTGWAAVGVCTMGAPGMPCRCPPSERCPHASREGARTVSRPGREQDCFPRS